MKSLGVLLFGIAALVICGITTYLDISRKRKCSVEIEAEVTDVKRKHYSSGKKRSNDYSPVLMYKVDGKEHGGLADIASMLPHKFKPGQTMTVFYDPENPDNFRVKGKVGNIKWCIGGIILGIFCIYGYFYIG